MMNNYPSGYSEPPTWDEYLEAQDAAIKNYIQNLEQKLADSEAERNALKSRMDEEPTEEMIEAGAKMFEATLHSAANFKHHAYHVYMTMVRDRKDK